MVPQPLTITFFTILAIVLFLVLCFILWLIFFYCFRYILKRSTFFKEVSVSKLHFRSKIGATVCTILLIFSFAINLLFFANHSGQTSENTSESLAPGKIAYHIDDKMKVDSQYAAIVSISKSENDSVLFTGIDSSGFKTDTLRISSRVKVNLIDPSGGEVFRIIALNTEEQLVDDRTNTVWSWQVTPKQSGENMLVLRATAKVHDKFGDSYKDIQVYRKSVIIKSNPQSTIKNFLAKNWQWIITTLALPLAIWLYRLITKNRKITKPSTSIGFKTSTAKEKRNA